jgi:hypothetical protein
MNSLRIALITLPLNRKTASTMALSCYFSFLFAYRPIGHMRDPHSGVGTLAVADWWFGTAGAFLGVTAAAAAPATTTDRAKMRITCFIVGNPLAI